MSDAGHATADETLVRCAWAEGGASLLMRRYHDEEWGVPVHDDRRLFEFLLLEAAQAGLSWNTILTRRAAYSRAFDDFDPARVAEYDDARCAALLAESGIIRNRAKVSAAVKNARAFLAVQEQFGSFDAFIWRSAGGAPQQNAWVNAADVPAHTFESAALSHELRARGFSFVGSTICYAFMQATGIVNDHTVGCFRWDELRHGK